jgi:exodeoxyribonuclease-3
MKIVSWNVNGIRAIAKKTFFSDLELIGTDILCLQEIKAQGHQVAEALKVTKGINSEEHDKEGRVLCLEYEAFFLVNVYVPNSGSELKRLGYRQDWDNAFFNYLKDLERDKPVILCGDLNVAHKPIDLARPKANYNKTAGYMQEEIDGMDRYIRGGLADTFRHIYPDVTGKYSWWSYRLDARSKNVGWRIDYFLVSESLIPTVKDAFILDYITGSDHCPVGIDLKL